jgi:MFS family permease
VTSTSDEVDRRVVLLVVTLTSFLTPFASSSFNIALPSISKEFSFDAIIMSWASLAYLLASAMFLVPFGSLADVIGRVEVVPKVYSALTSSINIAFIAFSGLCLMGILASLVSSRELKSAHS